MSGRRRKKAPALAQKFTKKMQKKLVMLFMAILLAFIFLVGRITYINASDGESYTKTVLDQQQYTSRTIPFKRGDIIDANGTKLATSERVYNVILDAKVLLSDEKKAKKRIKETKAAVAEYLGIEETQFESVLEEKPNSRYNILKKGVDYDTAQAYKKAVEDNVDVQGVWLEEDYIRTYPYNALAADVLGFVSNGNVGTIGLEASYNKILNGMDGREFGYQNAESATEQTVKEPVNGNSIVTTIDTNLQSIVEKHVLAFNEAHKNGAQEGEGSKNTAVLIMRPNTGEILAMSSYPNFDLNNPRDLSKYYTEEQINAMTAEEKLSTLNGLWRNFCVSDSFEPGSTVKPLTLAAGFETGKLTGGETYYCGGSLQVADYNIKCISFDKGGHGTQTLEQVLENSCNVALMQMGMNIGVEDFIKYQHIFGFGENTNIDLPGDAPGILIPSSRMGEVDLATNSFGQNYNVTMVQLAASFASLVNGGNYYEPHLVKEIQDQSGNVISNMEPVLQKKTVSQETSNILKSYMYSVVENGSGTPARVEGYAIGGKTGTAEKLPRGENKNLVSFIGYAPQENPEVVVYVLVDEPNVPNQALSSNLISTLASDIMAEAFPYLQITKTQPQE